MEKAKASYIEASILRIPQMYDAVPSPPVVSGPKEIEIVQKVPTPTLHINI